MHIPWNSNANRDRTFQGAHGRYAIAATADGIYRAMETPPDAPRARLIRRRLAIAASPAGPADAAIRGLACESNSRGEGPTIIRCCAEAESFARGPAVGRGNTQRKASLRFQNFCALRNRSFMPPRRHRQLAQRRSDVARGSLFCCRVRGPKGARYWHLRHRFAGKPRKFSIGRYPVVTLDWARSRQKSFRDLLAHGIDPSALRAALGKHRFGVTMREWEAEQGRTHAGTEIYPLCGSESRSQPCKSHSDDRTESA